MPKELREDVAKFKKLVAEQNANIEKERENLKRSQKQTLKPKSTKIEMKNFLEGYSKADLNI